MALLKDFQYHAPKTVQETLGLLKKKKGAAVLGGGTLLLNVFKKASCLPKDVVSLRRVAGLSGIKEEKGFLRIGAMTTIAELCENVVIRKNFPSLDEACCRLGTTPLRHMATIGGNVASRFFWVDLPTVLISLDARLVLETGKGTKSVPVDAFLAKKENAPFFLTHIEVPRRRPIAFYYRHTRAMPVDIATLTFAFAAVIKNQVLADVRLALNSTLEFPIFCPATSAVFEGKEPGKISLIDAQKALETDTEESKLDEFKRHSLAVDLEDICIRLKSGERT